MKAARQPLGSPCFVLKVLQPHSCAPIPGRSSFSAALSWKQWLFGLLAIAALSTPLHAQKYVSATVNMYARNGMSPVKTNGSTVNLTLTIDEEKCFPWNLSELRATSVTATRLKVPSQATREFEKACNTSNKNKFEEAEQHARSAIDKFQDYSAAWVMLGLILEQQHKAQEARDACYRAAAIDATYMPAYLCEAEFSVRNQQWEEVLNAADQALGLKSERDPYALYYRAMAYFHMNNLVEAKKSGLQAVEMEANHYEPSLHFLLAQIFGREGDTPNAAAQLQQLMTHHIDRQQEDAAKRLLAKLESQQPAK